MTSDTHSLKSKYFCLLFPSCTVHYLPKIFWKSLISCHLTLTCMSVVNGWSLTKIQFVNFTRSSNWKFINFTFRFDRDSPIDSIYVVPKFPSSTHINHTVFAIYLFYYFQKGITVPAILISDSLRTLPSIHFNIVSTLLLDWHDAEASDNVKSTLKNAAYVYVEMCNVEQRQINVVYFNADISNVRQRRNNVFIFNVKFQRCEYDYLQKVEMSKKIFLSLKKVLSKMCS